ncbi:unnamed protein product [Heligmosomoides polygyrus]|uniref:Transcription and mRNA export factor ENY2 n=1 Tax=Heligmosomoides polygyrus TaxID=6339 RepID=A0A3P7ZZM1_HELPZ|nr:unnamed protein product [Heligmosomoides polygyrus]
MQPFADLLGVRTISDYLFNSVSEEIFATILHQKSEEIASKKESDEGATEESSGIEFDYGAVKAMLFDVGKRPETISKRRKKLYDLVRKFEVAAKGGDPYHFVPPVPEIVLTPRDLEEAAARLKKLQEEVALERKRMKLEKRRSKSASGGLESKKPRRDGGGEECDENSKETRIMNGIKTKEDLELEFSSSGEKERAKEVLVARLRKDGWVTEVKTMARRMIKERGVDNVNLEMLYEELKQPARRLVSEDAKKELYLIMSVQNAEERGREPEVLSGLTNLMVSEETREKTKPSTGRNTVNIVCEIYDCEPDELVQRVIDNNDKMNALQFENARLRRRQLEKKREELMGTPHQMEIEEGKKIDTKEDPIFAEWASRVVLTAKEAGADLDRICKEISAVDCDVYDASGNRMDFLGCMETDLELDDVVLLGTNALEKLGVRVIVDHKSRESPERSREWDCTPTSSAAVVAERECVPPGQCKMIQENANEYKAKMKEQYDKRKAVNPERLPKVGERVFLKMNAEKGASKHPKLTFDWQFPKQLMMTEDTTHPLHVLFQCHEKALAKPPGDFNGYRLNVPCPFMSDGDGNKLDRVLKGLPTNMAAIKFDNVYRLAQLVQVWLRDDLSEREKLMEMAKKQQDISAEALAVALLYYRENCLHFQLSEEKLEPCDFYHEHIVVGAVSRRMSALYQNAMSIIHGKRWEGPWERPTRSQMVIVPNSLENLLKWLPESVKGEVQAHGSIPIPDDNSDVVFVVGKEFAKDEEIMSVLRPWLERLRNRDVQLVVAIAPRECNNEQNIRAWNKVADNLVTLKSFMSALTNVKWMGGDALAEEWDNPIRCLGSDPYDENGKIGTFKSRIWYEKVRKFWMPAWPELKPMTESSYDSRKRRLRDIENYGNHNQEEDTAALRGRVWRGTRGRKSARYLPCR